MRQYNFYVYMLTNTSKKVLYIGVTNDLERRLTEHYFAKSAEAGFTGKYKCYYLIWFERYQYIQHAIEREKELKGWSRKKKDDLIAEENSKWNFLNSEIMDWPPLLNN